MSGCSRDALKEHLKLINEQLANKKSEYAESLSKLNVKLQQYLDDNGHLGPATATTTTTTTSNSTSATTSDTGADDGVSNAGGEETNDKSQSVTSKQTLNGGETEEKTKTPAADASKGLLELLSRARRMCWDESHLCKASLTDIQEWLSTLVCCHGNSFILHNCNNTACVQSQKGWIQARPASVSILAAVIIKTKTMHQLNINYNSKTCVQSLISFSVCRLVRIVLSQETRKLL
eukprot:scpid80243/ scgid4877/ 